MYQPSEKFISQLQRHEGFYPAPYLCPAGVVTIGYGTNLEAHPKYIPFEGIRAQVMTGKLSGKNLLQALRSAVETGQGARGATRPNAEDATALASGGREAAKVSGDDAGAGVKGSGHVWQWRKKDGTSALLEEVAACHDALMSRCAAYRHLREYGADLPSYDDPETSWHVRADALLNMAFNLGVDGLLGFYNTLSSVRAGDYDKAGDNMLASKWARQVKGRAIELAAQMKTGRYAQ